MKKILSILLENESGALSRVIGLFSQRGYNIDSVTVAPTEDPTLSKMTIQTTGSKHAMEQIEKQLHKLIDVFKIIEIKKEGYIEREIMLVKIQNENIKRNKIIRSTQLFKGSILDNTSTSYTIQLSGTNEKLNSFLNIIRKISNIIEIARSGIIGVTRG